ncbi:MAG: hydrogenase-4 component G [Desulfotignum sp.]
MTNISNTLPGISSIKLTSPQLKKNVGGNKILLKQSMQTEIIQFSLQVRTDTKKDFQSQNALVYFNQLDEDTKSSLLYNGNPISELTTEKAAELVSDKGYFGVSQTSQRIIDFVVKGAGDDIERLKSGREGILQGFKEAEKAWGGKLPEISYETLTKSLEAIDEKIRKTGGSVVDLRT